MTISWRRQPPPKGLSGARRGASARTAAFVLVALVVASIASAQTRRAIPGRLDGPNGPVWLSADLVRSGVSPSGKAPPPVEPGESRHWRQTERLDQLRYRLAEAVDLARRKAPCVSHHTRCYTLPLDAAGEGCYRPFNFFGGDGQSQVENLRSFHRFVGIMSVIVTGTIEATEIGFASIGQPDAALGTLLQIKVDEHIRWPDEATPPDRVFAFYDYAPPIEFGNTSICRGATGWPAPPQRGDRIVVFTEFSPLETSGGTVVPTHVAGLDLAWQGAGAVRATANLSERFAQVRVPVIATFEDALREAAGRR